MLKVSLFLHVSKCILSQEEREREEEEIERREIAL